MRILIASNNQAKVERIRKLLTGTGVECLTPVDLDIKIVEIVEGSDIADNAQRKALTYRDLTDLPILANDTAFMIEGEVLDPAKVKRNALEGRDEAELTQPEIAEAILKFYCNLVQQRGKPIPCCWEDCYALVLPDGTIRTEHGQRPVTLTDRLRGEVNPYFPLRSLYIVGPTGKYTCDQTEEDEALELSPLREALYQILKLAP
ncbi:MAG: non-canonical purine NTP pyrophosphatase [Candidatus Uhrbacteria bacterium]